MPSLSKISCALVFGALAACAPAKPTVHPVVKLAQFDLQCPREELSYTQISKKMIGVRGCGKQTKYVKLCRVVQGWWDEECQWVQN